MNTWSKRLLCLLIALMPLGALAEAPREPIPVQPRLDWSMGQPSHLPFKRYDNLVYGYGFSLPGEFALTDEYKDYRSADGVYDGRSWSSPDGRYSFFFQLKQPSYASLQEEIDSLPQYLDFIRPEIELEGGRDLRYVNDEAIVHALPAGPMLENATQYESALPDGKALQVVTIYLDYYDTHNEYIFGLVGIDTGYEEAAELLRRIGQSITIQSIRVMLD